MHVVARRALDRMGARDETTSFLARHGRLQSFRGFDPRLDHKVRDKTRTSGFHRIVRGVMQPHAVLFCMPPPVGADVIKRSRKLACCLGQRLRLF